MFQLRFFPLIKTARNDWWKPHLLDLALVIIAGLLLTGIAFILPIHLRLATLLLCFLFILLWLVHRRGIGTAVIAAVIVCAIFDFLFVPPLFSIRISAIEDGWELLIFLAFVILFSVCYSRVNERAEKAKQQREEEALRYEEQLRKQHEEVNRHGSQMTTYYEVMQAIREEKDVKAQLKLMARAIEEMFACCGVSKCTFFVPDIDGRLFIHRLSDENSLQDELSASEEDIAAWVMKNAQPVVQMETPLIARENGSYMRRVVASNTMRCQKGYRCSYLTPIISGQKILGESGQKVIGVLHMRIDETDHPDLPGIKRQLEMGCGVDATQPGLFSQLLDHATFLIEQALIERALRQQESVERELQRRTDELHTAILSSVSHDFHTPLTQIKGVATSLLGQQMQACSEEEYRQMLADVVSEADRLERMVTRMLDLSRIEQGALKIDKELYPIDGIILNTLGRGHMRSLIAGRKIVMHIPDDLPPVELDPILIEQVLVNLIENAIRYTPTQSPIEVGVEADNEQLIVSVGDRGPGIPSHELDRVFESFYRVGQQEKGDTRAMAGHGSGLGLAVCQGFVKAHGGSIWAENRQGGGAIFQFSLPLG
jgi:two-component system sensor histidine kinase KdpD